MWEHFPLNGERCCKFKVSEGEDVLQIQVFIC